MEDATLMDALNTNLRNAALCGVRLITEEQFSEEELYCSITRLSYQGIWQVLSIVQVFYKFVIKGRKLLL